MRSSYTYLFKHPDTKPIAVADAAMPDEERLTGLRGKHISYIVGARLSNLDLNLVKQIRLISKK